MTTQDQDEKRYDPRDTTLKFVNRKDELDPYSDGLVAEMSCGHAVTPESLTRWCRSLLNQGVYKFTCPACVAEWSYPEVRRLAALTVEEMEYFEEKIAQLAATDYSELQICPGCKTYVEREDLTNLSVRCMICTADNNKVYEFCCQCLRPWKGRAPRSDRCDNDGCVNQKLEVLKNCKTTDFQEVEGADACPFIRACPTCGEIVEHNKTGCKNITCPRCHKEFCFLCLKLTPVCLKTSTHYMSCSDGVAPRQTSIPMLCRK
ncbi:probable E3 ubiquitin-protein ligase ARI7 [Neolamprologus brichardi]|uniref:Probable E3 ubiquitin-protein ligase ARI7-like n=1 Tax=Neolamprologus brichardi TaxID=32507 RepID=A0A3Q4I4V3_NEOBR|nr:probable E3 ubiquitin-protein ligase ARI7 [Neolamprologus brichardi]